MYMGQSHCVFHRDGWEQLRHYKHIDTRRYLNLAEDGTCFRYSEGGYTPISTEEAVTHVFPVGARIEEVRAGKDAEEGKEKHNGKKREQGHPARACRQRS